MVSTVSVSSPVIGTNRGPIVACRALESGTPNYVLRTVGNTFTYMSHLSSNGIGSRFAGLNRILPGPDFGRHMAVLFEVVYYILKISPAIVDCFLDSVIANDQK